MNGKKIGGWIVRDGIAAAGCSSMGTGRMGGENYCGNLLWQSCLLVLYCSPLDKAVIFGVERLPRIGV